MKRKTKIVLINGFLLSLMLAFNNCGQAGDIGLSKQMPTSSADANNNDLGGNPSAPNQGTVPTDSSPSQMILTKVEKTILLSETQKADILFVVDNSGSMKEEQSNMSARFPSFIKNLEQINWRAGIITTDVSDPALPFSDGQLTVFENGQNLLDSQLLATDAENLFSKGIQRTERGSSDEQGIFATYRFLERESVKNAPFLRADASLNVVIVSDADETPPKDAKGNVVIDHRNNPEKLLAYLIDKYPLKKFQFHSIVVKENDKACLGVSSNEGYGLAYEKLSDLTKGIKGSVCAPDYGGQLAFVSEKIKELVKSVSLDCEPAIDAKTGKPMFEVKLNNTEAIEVDKIVGNQVFFKGALPTGSIKVEYFCLKPQAQK